MKITLFEVQEWERDVLRIAFPHAEIVMDKLTDENVSKYAESEIVSCFIYSQLSSSVLAKLPSLKYVTTRSTGYDHIDLKTCRSRSVPVSNVPEYGSATVAEHTFALIISLTRKIYQSVNQAKALNFHHESLRGMDLEGKTLGVIGLGKIGIHVLKIAMGFGMKVIVHTRTHDEKLSHDYGFSYVELPDLLKTADVVTLHMPFNSETKHIINKDAVQKMKKGSYLINTARGGLIETEAIVMGLEKDILAGVGLDVLEEEQLLGEEAAILTDEYRANANLYNLVYDHMLINHPKVLITPHNAFNSVEALGRITETTIENIKGFQSGTLKNVIP